MIAPSRDPTSPPLDQLDTWYGIAGYLDVSIKTAQLWARNLRLPVYRVPGKRGRVFAYGTELNRWKHGEPNTRPHPIVAESRELRGWKQIAYYFDVSLRTIHSWEHERGLPVHRLPGNRGGVFAVTTELEIWKFSYVSPITHPLIDPSGARLASTGKRPAKEDDDNHSTWRKRFDKWLRSKPSKGVHESSTVSRRKE